jgi:glycine betaine transporter
LFSIRQKLFSKHLALALSGGFCILLIVLAGIFPEAFRAELAIKTQQLLHYFGYYYLLLGFGAVLVLVLLAFSSWGKIKLGHSKPEYGWLSWIAMLYSTGMGAGLLLRAVQEPVYYFANPPRATDLEAGVFALQYTFFHWGLTPWAMYGLFGLLIGYNMYVNNKGVRTSDALSPRFQKTGLAAIVDALTIICTLLGVVAAVGLGSTQLLEGISLSFEVPKAFVYLLVLLICFVATGSAMMGVGRGIRKLSNLNILMALVLLSSALIAGVAGGWLTNLVEATVFYFRDFIPMSLNLGGEKVSQTFLTDWTYFYWAFWLSWAPFTGVFIARISRGRTIRTFIIGTLLVPALGTFIWFSVFGTAAFGLIESGEIVSEAFESIYSALFNFLSFLPFSQFLKTLATVLVFTFLLTSVDSAVYVLSMFSDNGSSSPRLKFRIGWGVGILLFTATVIYIGADQLLQAVSQLLILCALPFSFLFIGLTIRFFIQLFHKHHSQ